MNFILIAVRNEKVKDMAFFVCRRTDVLRKGVLFKFFHQWMDLMGLERRRH